MRTVRFDPSTYDVLTWAEIECTFDGFEVGPYGGHWSVAPDWRAGRANRLGKGYRSSGKLTIRAWKIAS